MGGMVVATATLALISPVLNRSVRAAWQDSPKAVVDEAWQIVHREYVDGTFNQVNWQTVRQQLLNQNYTSREQAYQSLSIYFCSHGLNRLLAIRYCIRERAPLPLVFCLDR